MILPANPPYRRAGVKQKTRASARTPLAAIAAEAAFLDARLRCPPIGPAARNPSLAAAFPFGASCGSSDPSAFPGRDRTVACPTSTTRRPEPRWNRWNPATF